jgi:2-dehydropantoate 2-reductase
MEYTIRKISLVGLGAMGSFFAPRLYEAYGENFRLIADGKRKERLEKEGTEINGKIYRFPVVSPAETGDPADLIIIATKGYSLQQAIKDIGNQVASHTLIMGVMNGIESEGELISAFGAEHVLHSFMRVSIVMKDHRTSYNPALGAVHFGERNGNTEGNYSARVTAVRDVFRKASVPYIIDEDMEKAIWFKYACNVSENLVCALLGISFGWFKDNEDAEALRRGTFREIMTLANARGIRLTEEDFEKQCAAIKTLPPQNKPSTLQDLEAGKHTEVEMFAGTAVRLGKESGLRLPNCEFLLHAVRVVEKIKTDN